MGVVAFVLAEVMIIPFNGKGLWNFHLTRVLISFVGGFIASGYVFQLINVVNLSIIYIYNLDIIRGHP